MQYKYTHVPILINARMTMQSVCKNLTACPMAAPHCVLPGIALNVHTYIYI